jgi:hypothetical protein
MLIYAPFAGAVMDPEHPVPTDLVDRGNRFDIYRNNVASSLVAALAKSFPVVERMLGEEYFTALALAYVRQSPPTSRILAEYGEGFPAFVEDFTPLADYPYLADMARLELIRIAVMRAADMPSDRDAGGAVDAEALLQMRCLLSPSARLIASQHPIATLWRRHQDDTPQPLEAWPEERLLVFRGNDGLVHAPLFQVEFQFFSNLSNHPTLGDALFALHDKQQAADILRTAINLLNAGALFIPSEPTNI